ncbi:MAG: GNAT family N-acetyltransferase [Christensenellales bacterium]|jgi:predicted N-acetyltransferase YhbS
MPEISYRVAKPSDRWELLDFANFVFSQAHRPHDFRKLLPKVYGDAVTDEEMAACHYIAMRDGRIKALACCPTITVDFAGTPLEVGTVGTVSVHPYARGEGHMRFLMHMMIDDMRQKGVDALVLGGQRQRYNYYGFEVAGEEIAFSVNRTNMRHVFGGASAGDIRFDEMHSGDGRIEAAYALYMEQPLHAERPLDSFLEIARSWSASVYAVMRGDQMLGYVCSGGKDSLSEVVLEDEATLPQIIGAWLSIMGADSVRIPVKPHETQRIARLSEFAENAEFPFEEMILPLNWANCMRAGLSYKALYEVLEDGERTYCLDGQVVRIAVEDGIASVEEMEVGAVCDVTLSGLEAVRAIYSPLARFVGREKWMPLPFNLSAQDKF